MTKLGKTITIVLSAILCIVIAFSAYKISSLDRQLSISERNLAAVTDTIHELETKNGELVYWNQALTVDKTGLQNQLEKEELDRKEIEKSLRSKISSLTKIVSEFTSDTIVLKDTVRVIDDSTRLSEFRYADDWLTVSGKTLFSGALSETTITLLKVRVPVTVGQTEDMKLFVHTENPNVTIELLEGYSVQGTGSLKTRSRWSLGINCGFGVQYGLLERKIDFGPQFGVGVSYRIF